MRLLAFFGGMERAGGNLTFTSVFGGGIIKGAADAHDDPAAETTARRPGKGARSVRSGCRRPTPTVRETESPMPDGEPQRRSQGERTAATIARLLDATITAIVEIGYSRATVREICTRAGVSQGGLFRHFPTRKDLLVATLAELHDRQLAAMSEVAAEADPHAAIARMRDVINAPDTTVWLELCVAARTDRRTSRRSATVARPAPRDACAASPSSIPRSPPCRPSRRRSGSTSPSGCSRPKRCGDR